MNSNFSNAEGLEFVFENTDESENEIIITGFHKEVSGHVIIPSVIDGVPVTNIRLIGNFSEINSGITSIYIPYSVNRIHPRIFDYCINLLTIVVSESNSQYLTFDGFLMDKSATKLIGCCRTKQGKAIIPSSVIEIKDGAFANCSQLESIIIPNSVITIGAFSFGNCKKLADLLIPKSVIKLGKYAFYECSSLLSINISSYLREIGEGAYAGCDSLTTITVSDDNLCFNEINDVLYTSEKTRLIACNKKKSGKCFIPITVINIDEGAFSGCSAITSIIIPASVTSIGDENFNGCTSLDQITVDGANSSYSTSDGVLFCDRAKRNRLIVKYPARKKGAFTIPRSVKSIAYAAFAGCTELTDIIFHDGIEEISYMAFSGCSSLTSISIPKSVRMISNRAFYNCTELANIYTTAFAGIIASCAFENCNKLTFIAIEETYQNHPEEWGRTTIEPLAFKGCPMLNLFVYRVRDKAVEIIRCNTSILHNIVIPNEIDGRPVTEIGFGAFEDCVGLTKVTIPDSLHEIDFHSFPKVTDLVISISKEINPNFPRVDGVLFNREKTSIIRYDPTRKGSCIIPETVTAVSSMAFSGCDKLSGILIPNSVNAIGDYAFEYCAGITNITIPSSVKEISNGVFSNCNCLTSISIPDKLNKIGEYAFKDCTSLTSIIIPASVNYIGVGAFEGCTGLTSIVIPESVKKIGESAFSGCTSLATITISDSSRNIGRNAFFDCPKMPDSV